AGAQPERTEQAVDAAERERDVKEDVQVETEPERADEDQPLRRIENLIRRIRRHRLAGGDEAVPPRKLAARDHLAHDLLHRKVIANQIAEVESVAGEDQVREAQ